MNVLGLMLLQEDIIIDNKQRNNITMNIHKVPTLEDTTGWSMSDEHLCVISPAGSGKSSFILGLQSLFGDNILYSSPTGVSALEINGSTLNLLFGLDTEVWSHEIEASHNNFYKKFGRNGYLIDNKKILTSDSLMSIVIDEVGMVRPDKFAQIDYYMRKLRSNNSPFGGVPVKLYGDIFQLGSIVNRREEQLYNKYYNTSFLPNSDVFKDMDFTVAFTSQVFRQQCPVFVSHLNNLREGNNIKSSVDWINDNALHKANTDGITLVPTRKECEVINTIQFNSLKGKPKNYQCFMEGNLKGFSPPVEKVISLKVGCKVIIKRNHGDGFYVNGDTGVITKMSHNKVEVMLDRNGELVDVCHYKWNPVKRYLGKDGKIHTQELGTFTQLPLKLGYAATIHSTQGLTLSNAKVNLSEVFTDALSYVALSRIKSIKGLDLQSPVQYSDIRVNQEAKAWYNRMQSGTSK